MGKKTIIIKSIVKISVITTIFVFLLSAVLMRYDKETESNTETVIGIISNVEIISKQRIFYYITFNVGDKSFCCSFRKENNDQEEILAMFRQFNDNGNEYKLTYTSEREWFRVNYPDKDTVIDIRDNNNIYLNINEHNRSESQTKIVYITILSVFYVLFIVGFSGLHIVYEYKKR